ncbi:VQ motif-containing protein 9 [Senna tora]|uniref:VQ motif-containing protein 9 n=1 Tax=Senna tora TaxID=362788 RepID=A0A834WRS4_9FABA|nr:VQ motif-containing protein 9 [Senna tora]
MDKSCQSSADNATITAAIPSSGRDQYVRQVSKFSHKISKPIIAKKPTFDPSLNQQQTHNLNHNPPPPQQQQHQPPVYNINKNDFRDVVQKLTGSPAHDRISTPPPIHQPKPPSSRLHRFGRPVAPLSPLPPFPTVHAPAESPVSAYMRYLQNSVSNNADSNSKQFSPLAPLVSPRWNNFTPPEPQVQVQGTPPSQFQMPSSPVPFGCLNSPKSPYPLLSPSLLFSPTSGQLGFPQFPLSPTVPIPSPIWRGL